MVYMVHRLCKSFRCIGLLVHHVILLSWCTWCTGQTPPTIGANFTRKKFLDAAMSLLKKISEAKFHGSTPAAEISSPKISHPEISPPENFDGGNFPCGHSVAACGWICSATRRTRCAICDPRAAGVGSVQHSPTLAAQGDGDDVSPILAEQGGERTNEINPGERQGHAFAFFDVETANGAYRVATRFPGLWGRSGGSRQKPAPNVAAGLMLGWAAERDGPSLGHARFASIQEWQRSLGVELDEHGRFVAPDAILATRKNHQHGDGRQ